MFRPMTTISESIPNSQTIGIAFCIANRRARFDEEIRSPFSERVTVGEMKNAAKPTAA